jgi:hypothetical protein
MNVIRGTDVPNRKAVITTHTVVECYEDGALIKTIDVSYHSMRYVLDTQENWENGIIKHD